MIAINLNQIYKEPDYVQNWKHCHGLTRATDLAM